MNVGELVTDFEAPDQHGTVVRFSELLQKGPVVLFFYPKAMTAGCTKESCHFRDLGAEFDDVGAQRVGISADSVERQSRFDEKHALGYPLLSDSDKRIARQFGVKRPGPLMNKRSTFIVDTDMSLLEVIASETNMDVHADKALEILRRRHAS